MFAMRAASLSSSHADSGTDLRVQIAMAFLCNARGRFAPVSQSCIVGSLTPIARAASR